MSNSQQKPNYTERYYDEVDSLYREWRRPVWEDSLGDVAQEGNEQIGASGWVEVLDSSGNAIVEINQDGLFWLHHEKHENAGEDEIDVTGLSGLLADPQTPLPHVTRHQNGGDDELSVAGLSGLLADAQTPLPHAASHQNAGTDEIDVTGLSGLLADAQTPLAHTHTHDHDADYASLGHNHDADYAGITHSHNVEALDTIETDTNLRLRPDGLGGVEWVSSSVGAHDHDTDYEPLGAVATHEADTTSVHGIADTSVLATDAEVATAISTHEGLADPHPTYQTSAEVDTKIATHAGLADPHTGYVLEADANWVDLTDGGETALHTHAGGGGGVTDHGALTGLGDDDHPQYLTETEADVLYEEIGAVNTHVSDISEAHLATAVSIADSGGFTAEVNVEGAIAELYGTLFDHSSLHEPGAADAMTFEISTLTFADLVTAYPLGVSIFNGGVAEGWPSDFTQVTTFKFADARIIQLIHTHSGEKAWVRIGHTSSFGAGTWGSLTPITPDDLDRIRLAATDDAALTSTLHAFQIGADGSTNIIADSNEIMARNNGAASELHLNTDGGVVTINQNAGSGGLRIMRGGLQVGTTSATTDLQIKLGADVTLSRSAFGVLEALVETLHLRPSASPSDILVVGSSLASPALKITDTGRLDAHYLEREVKPNANTNVNHATWTQVTGWAAGTFNRDVTFSSNQYTIDHSGLYAISCAVQWPSNATGERVIAYALDGVSPSGSQDQQSWMPATAAQAPVQRAVWFRYLTAGTTIRLYCYQSSGGVLTLPSSSEAEFSVVRLGV